MSLLKQSLVHLLFAYLFYIQSAQAQWHSWNATRTGVSNSTGPPGITSWAHTGPTPSPTSTPGSQPSSHSRKYFHIQAIRTGRRYQSGSRYWAFSGSDATIVESIEAAAYFYIEHAQLRFENYYVGFDWSSGYGIIKLESAPVKGGISFGLDKAGTIQVFGKPFILGHGNGLFCISNDGNVFVAGSQQPPFTCTAIGLIPKRMYMP
jgi:hypothetical protein